MVPPVQRLTELRSTLVASPQLSSEEFSSRLGQRVTEIEQKGMTETARFVHGIARAGPSPAVGVDRAFAEEMEQDPMAWAGSSCGSRRNAGVRQGRRGTGLARLQSGSRRLP